MRGKGSSPARASRWAISLAAVAMLGASACQPAGGPTNPVGPDAADGEGGGLFATEPAAEGLPTAGGAIVARIEMPAPPAALDKFVVKATLPVPKGKFPRADGKYPYSVRNTSGMCAPTQIEIVSRYPATADGADVIEVLARVDRPAGVAQGQMITFEVVENVHAKAGMPIRQGVMQLLNTPGAVRMRAEDCFGHPYTLDLLAGMRNQSGNVDVLKQGQSAVQLRNYGVMMPATANLGAPNGALPHFFGVHTYLTTWANEDFVTIDLRVNNGSSGSDKAAAATLDDPLGDVYFKRLALEVPQGWQVLFDVNDPALGGPVSAAGRVTYDIVKPNADGTLHLMPSQAITHRRIAIGKASALAKARALLDQTHVAFCVDGFSPNTNAELYSWWNPTTTRYYPQKFKLPKLADAGVTGASGELWGRYNSALSILQSGAAGQHPFDAPRMGWAHPWGVGYGGMTGGTEIWFYDGFKVAEEASQVGYRALELKHRMYSDRMPQVLYDKDGDHTTVERWVTQGPTFSYVHMTYQQGLLGNSNDPFGIKSTPNYQRAWVAANSLTPSYEAQLRSYKPIDFQHYTRYLQSPMALSWLGNDSLAKDDLRMAAEIFRLSYHEYFSSPSGYIMGSGMLSDIQAASGNPGYGINFGRGESWGIVSAIAAYGLSDQNWRSRWLPWFQKAGDLLSNGQSSCNGIIQRVVNNKILSGQFQARQSIEQAITENMLWSLKESVFRDVDPPRFAATEQTLLDSCNAMIGPLAWNPTLNGPYTHLAVAPLNATNQPFCTGVPTPSAAYGVDRSQTPSSFAYGYALSGNPAFLSKAALMLGNASLPTAVSNINLHSTEISAALIALVD